MKDSTIVIKTATGEKTFPLVCKTEYPNGSKLVVYNDGKGYTVAKLSKHNTVELSKFGFHLNTAIEVYQKTLKQIDTSKMKKIH